MSEQLPTTTEENSDDTEYSRDPRTIRKRTADGGTQIQSGATDEGPELKNMVLADEESPLAQYTGETGPQKKQTDDDFIAEMLSEHMYDDDSVPFRELQQNAETACIDAARLLLHHHPDYGDEWLNRDVWVDGTTGETIALVEGTPRQAVLAEYDVESQNLRKVSFPRGLDEVISAARSIGYDPTIEITVKRDERMLVIEDNGIGMTAETFHEAYNYNGRSGAKASSDTGGMWGIGSQSFGNYTGTEGGMTAITRTRRPDATEADREGLKAYTYLGGYNEMPNDDIPDTFRGTRLEIPVKSVENDGPYMGRFEGWAKQYAKGLRVPVLYQEFKGGNKVSEEEWGGDTLVQQFTDAAGNEPAIVMDRPGEFTAIGGPETEVGYQSYNDTRPDTWLVSMEIDRNYDVSTRTMWNLGVRIHDEQHMCVSGPHRGMNRGEIDSVHEDDIFTPTPTTDRDRLKSSDISEEFFEYVAGEFKSAEIERLSEIFEAILATDKPWTVFENNPAKWDLFESMVSYHGDMATSYEENFIEFVEDHDELPKIEKYDGDTSDPSDDIRRLRLVHKLFTEVEHAPSGVRRPKSKDYRNEDKIGAIIAKAPAEHVYMAASTGGNFTKQRKVVINTHDKWNVVVVSYAEEYDEYEEAPGFKYLKEVPLIQDDDHDYDVPQSIHDAQVTKSKGSSSNSGKAEAIEDRTLKLRTVTDNKSIDLRWKISQVMEYLEKGQTIDGHNHVILFPNGQDTENISDHYEMRRYGAIASVSQAEFDHMAHLERVMSYEEFVEWSASTVIATEEGAKTPAEMAEDDRVFFLLYADTKAKKRFLNNEEMKELLMEQTGERATHVNHTQAENGVFGVLDNKTWRRAQHAMYEAGKTEEYGDVNFVGIKFSFRDFPGRLTFETQQPGNSLALLKAKVENENWRNDSKAHNKLLRADGIEEALLRGCHDAGINPYEATNEDLESAIAGINPDEIGFLGRTAEERGGD